MLTVIRNITITLVFTAILIGLTPDAFSQENIIQTIQQVETMVMDKTVQPLGDAMSSSINSGLYNTAKVDKGFSMYVGVKAAGSSVNPQLLKLIGLEKLNSYVPFAVAQAEVGAYGTQVMFRYVPEISLFSKATIGFKGFGIKHCITSHFENSPVDVSLQFAYQMMEIKINNTGGSVETKSTAFNLQVSKELGFLTIYTGAQYEKTNLTMSYNFENIITFSKSFDNRNNFRGTVGINLGLGPVNLNADYSFGKTGTVSAGFGLGF